MPKTFCALVRVCAGRRYVLALAACCLLVVCELVQLMLTSYGMAGGAQITGADLPPLAMAAEIAGRSAAIWLLVPLAVCSYAEDCLADGYAALMQSGDRGARGVARGFMGVAAALSMGAAFAICLVVLLVCAVVCRGTLDPAYLAQLASNGVRVLTDGAAAGYGLALLVGMLRVVTLGMVSMAVALVARWRFAGVLAVPLAWLALSYTPALDAMAALLNAVRASWLIESVPAFSLMAYVDTPGSWYSFLGRETLIDVVVIAVATLAAMGSPRALRVRLAFRLPDAARIRRAAHAEREDHA